MDQKLLSLLFCDLKYVCCAKKQDVFVTERGFYLRFTHLEIHKIRRPIFIQTRSSP